MTDDVPNTWAKPEAWLERMGTKFVEVWFYARRCWVLERQVDDHDTFLDTVGMTFDRLRATHALWFDGDKWCVLTRSTGDTKRYPNREAAEMFAIHRG